MAEFKDAIDFVLKNEGGLSDNPSDKGGKTYYGISSSFLQLVQWSNWEKGITKEDAIKIYEKYFWDEHFLNEIESQRLATKIFDLVVNMGSKNAFTLIQRAANILLKNILIEDGIFGYKTLSAINSLDADILIENIKLAQSRYYQAVVLSNPSQKIFLAGWIKRAMQG